MLCRFHLLAGIFGASLFLLSTAAASAPDSTISSEIVEELIDDEPYKGKLTILPIIGYTPETSLMKGALFIKQYKPRNSTKETRTSNARLTLLYTGNRQTVLELEHTTIKNRDSWILPGSISYKHFPEKYWGIGRGTKAIDELDAEYRQINAEQAALYQMWPSIFIGPKLQAFKVYDVTFESPFSDTPDLTDIPGSSGLSTIGLGLTIQWDKRDRIVTPTKNHFVELSTMFFPSTSSDAPYYSKAQLDARRYIDIFNNERSILAFQAIAEFSWGDPMFLELSTIGGRRIMRGLYEGRFRDRHAGQIQVEWRQHLFRRLGFVGFAAAGDVWPSFSDLQLNTPKWSVGGGLRLNLNPNDPINIRLDFGYGDNDSGAYLSIGEAF